MTPTNKPTKNLQPKSSSSPHSTKPVIEHLQELKKRLFIVGGVIVLGCVVAFWFQRQLIAVLLKPSRGQHFIYTSPLGGVNFIFSFSLYIGLILATPVVIYHFIAFIQPIMKLQSTRFMVYCSGISTLAAAIGITAGYTVGLPNTLHTLLQQFDTKQIQPLLTIQSYISFVALYLLSAAVIVQMPLVMVIINRIVTLAPRRLLKYERHVVVVSLIVSFIMNPVPNIVSQLIVAVPIILMYNFGVGVIWFINTHRTDPLAA